MTRRPPRLLRLLPCLLSLGAAAQPSPAGTPAPAPAKVKPYTGHGAGSVAPEVLARYAPPPLAPEVSHRIQSMLDVRAPGAGVASPDGRRLYFTWKVTGTSQVWRLDGPQRFPVQMTGGEDTTWLATVAPDGSFLLVQRDAGGQEYPGLYVQSAGGGPLTRIQHLPRVQTFAEFVSDDSRWVYFRANDLKPDSFAIYRWERSTGNKERVFDQDGLWSVADHRPDGTLLLTKELGSAVTEIHEWNPATRTLRPIIGQGEREEFTAVYGAAGEILILTPKLGEFRRLYRWREGKLEAVTPEMKHDVSSVAIDDGRRRILYTVNEDGYTRLRAMDARTFKPLPLPSFPGADHVAPGTWTHNGRYTTLKVDSGTAPLAGYVLDWQTGKATQWQLPSAPEVDLTRFVRATLESYPARDGTPIPMFVRRPPGCAGKPCPVVVEFHGGPEGQAQPGFSPYAQLFIDAGYVFVEPNVRGSDGYGKTWFHADDGPKRLKVITDIEDCSRYIRQAWAVNGQAPRVAIVGGSYGGYAALMGMTRFAGAYDVGVAIVGFSNLLTFLENTAPYRRALRINEYGDPATDREALLALSPITYVDRLKQPLLLIQGANDPRVPAGEAIQMHDTLEARGLNVPLIIFPDEGHGSAKRANQVLELGHMLRFLDENLKDKPRS